MRESESRERLEKAERRQPPMAAPVSLASRAGAAMARYALPAYVAVVLVQASYVFLTDDNYPYAGISGTDGQAYYAFIRSMWIDRDLDFDNEFFEFNYNRHGFQTRDFLPRSPHNGRILNRFRIGFALLLAPFFLCAHALTVAGNAIGLWRLPPDGYSFIYQLAPPINTIFWAAVAFQAMQALLRRYFSRPVAAGAALTMLLAYQGAFPVIKFWCNPHPHVLLAFSLLMLLGFRVVDRRDTVATWVAMGCVVGLATLLRAECAVLALHPFVLFVMRCIRLLRRDGMRRSRAVSRLCARAVVLVPCAALLVAIQPYVWYRIWGGWFPGDDSLLGGHFLWHAPHFARVLFSTRHGLFYWSPVVLVGLVGLGGFVLSRRADANTLAALVPALVVYYLFSCWSIWWMGYSFGARQFIVITPLSAIGLGYLLERFGRWRITLTVLCSALVFWNWAMLWMFLNGHIPSDDFFHPLLPLAKFYELADRILPLP